MNIVAAILALLGAGLFTLTLLAVISAAVLLIDCGGWGGLREAYAIVQLLDRAQIEITGVSVVLSKAGRRMLRIKTALPVDELALYLPALRSDLLRDVFLAHVQGRGVLTIPLVLDSAARWIR